MLNKKSVDDINVKGQRVLVRCDFNVPLQDGKITDENRLVAALPTIRKLIADGGKVIHTEKPRGIGDEIHLFSGAVKRGDGYIRAHYRKRERRKPGSASHVEKAGVLRDILRAGTAVRNIYYGSLLRIADGGQVHIRVHAQKLVKICGKLFGLII